jgi:two-component system, LytTR family, response regulator LytT
LLINYRGKTVPIKIEVIGYFFIESDATLLYAEGQQHVISKTLDELEAILDPRQFFRANRQYLINRKFIKEVEPFFARKLVVKLTIPVKESIVISKAKASEFLRWLEL